MALLGLPTLEKTWQFDVNQLVTGTSRIDHHRKVLWAAKQSLISFASSAWTVAGSGDTVTAGMDAVDRWDAPTDIVFTVSDAGGTSTRSWIVLQNVNGSQLLLDCRRDDNPGGSQNEGIEIHIHWSPSGGFTGGATNAAPTATDERILASTGAWLAGINGAAQFRVHVLMSIDGANTLVFFVRNGACTSRWLFLTAVDGDAAWTLPYIADATNNANTTEATGGPNYSALLDTEAFAGVVSPGGLVFTCSLSTWGSVNDAIGQRLTNASYFTGEYPFLPVGIVSNTTGMRGRIGRVQDLWFGSAAVVTGTTFPSGVPQFAQFGDLVVPWDGSTPETT